VIASTDVAVGALYETQKSITASTKAQSNLQPTFKPTTNPTAKSPKRRHLATYNPFSPSSQINREITNQLFNILNMIEILTDDIVPGQRDVELVRSNVRLIITSTVFSSESQTNTSVILPSSDASLTQQNISAQSFKLDIPIPFDNAYKSAKQEVWGMGGATMPYYLFLDPDLSFKVHSDPLIIVAKDIATSCGGSRGQDCTIVATLKRRTDLLPDYPEESFVTTCHKGTQQTIGYSCKNGLNVTAYCDGQSDYYSTDYCPYYRETPMCTRIMPTLSESITDYCSAKMTLSRFLRDRSGCLTMSAAIKEASRKRFT
jgi:hypothetical protein